MSTAERPDLPGVRELSLKLDGESKHVLEQLLSGEQHTTLLKRETGLSRQSLHRRLDKLEADAVITTEKKQPVEGGQPRKHAELTERGHQLVDDGLIQGITDQSQNVETLHERLEEFERELRDELRKKPGRYQMHDTAEREARDVLDEYDAGLDELREDIERVQREAHRAKELAAEARDEDLQATTSRLDTRVKGIQDRLDRVQQRASTATTAVEELQEGAERRDRQIDALIQHVSRLAIQGGEFEDSLQTARTGMGMTKRQVERKLEELEELEQDIQWYERKVGKAKDSANRQYNELRKKVAHLENRLDELGSVGEK